MIIMFAFVGIASNAQSFGEKIQYGVLIIDGKSYIANDKFFRQFYNFKCYTTILSNRN